MKKITERQYKKRREVLANHTKCSLNGQPAQILGLKLKFPSVVAGNYTAQFAWSTIERILERDGQFFMEEN